MSARVRATPPAAWPRRRRPRSIGIEYDTRLVDYAQTRPDNPAHVRFQQGDATTLPFPDASFDLVFCRYLLLHMTDPMRVVREMMRVVRPGGFIVAYEGDVTSTTTSHPPCAARDDSPHVGRAVSESSGGPPAGALPPRGWRDGDSRGRLDGLEYDTTTIKRMYRLTAEATGQPRRPNGILTASEAEEMIAGLIRLEADDASVVVKFPDMWAIARR